MPHVVLEGEVDLAEVRDRFQGLLERSGDDVLKIDTLYVEREGRELLLDTLVVESGHPQRFFIQARRKGGGLTVRLLPQTDPEKTDGVKRSLARVATFIRDLRPDRCRFGATNIGEFLP